MKTSMLVVAVLATYGCKKPDAYYVGEEQAPIVAGLRRLFEVDFEDACLNTEPLDSDEECGPPPSECVELWEEMPIGAPDEDSHPALRAEFDRRAAEWDKRRDDLEDVCPQGWDQRCWPSEKGIIHNLAGLAKIRYTGNYSLLIIYPYAYTGTISLRNIFAPGSFRMVCGRERVN